jgi:nucleoside-triphosphatase THEP1
MEVYVLSGPINSGKTTRLTHWISTQPKAAGLLSPKLPEGRSFLNIRNGETRRMEAELEENAVQEVGRYRFSAAVFNWANSLLISEAENPETEWLIVDEIGPLELKGLGLDPALQHLFSPPERALKLVLVVREALVEQVKAHYQLTRFPLFQLEL